MSIFFETISFIEVKKDAHMQRFVSGKAHILVATTVIEVGVNVPNASVMVDWRRNPAADSFRPSSSIRICNPDVLSIRICNPTKKMTCCHANTILTSLQRPRAR